MTIQNNRLNGINPLSYVGVNASQPPQVVTANVPPTTTTKGYPIGTIWIDGSGALALGYIYMGINATNGNALWPLFTEAVGGDILTLSDTTGLKVDPDGTGNVQLVGDAGSGINVVSTPGSNLLTISNANRVNGTAQTVGAVTANVLSVAVAANRAISATINLSGGRSDYTASYAATGNAGYNRAGGGLNVLPNVVITPTVTNGIAGTVGANLITSGNNIILQVTGEAGHTWNWAASAEIIVVSA